MAYNIYQFKIVLLDTDPLIWRRIQVPDNYSFWDLHVAIQDSMGWLDYHFHTFRIRGTQRHKMREIGIPVKEMEMEGIEILPGWEVKLSEFFTVPGIKCEYEYDFGDSWLHEILFEGHIVKEKSRKYPICLEGEMACPPEDCGGIPGYYDLLETLKHPDNEEYEDIIEWLETDYHPDEFDPQKVKFSNPKTRLKKAFNIT